MEFVAYAPLRPFIPAEYFVILVFERDRKEAEEMKHVYEVQSSLFQASTKGSVCYLRYSSPHSTQQLCALALCQILE